MDTEKKLMIYATWDDEAAVWSAYSDDVPGLVTEAPSMDKLVAKLKVMIPELLDENSYSDGDDETISFVVKSTLTSTAQRHAA